MNDKSVSMNAYESIEQLQINLRKLFRTLSYEPEEIVIKNPARLVLLLETLVNSGLLTEYMNVLSEQIVEATKLADDNRLDCWSMAESLKEAKAERKKQTKQLDNVQRNLESCEKRLKNSQMQIESTMHQLANHEKDQKDLIMNLILMRDSLLMKQGLLISDENHTDSHAEKIVTMLLKETANILTKSGVEILEDSGIFDSKRQTIVDTRPTEDTSLVNKIAEVFRPGYLLNGKQLRGQEVILYVAK